MQMFIKEEIMNDAQNNYGLIVPTKALINEVRTKIINDLDSKKNTDKINYFTRHNCSMVTAASDIA